MQENPSKSNPENQQPKCMRYNDPWPEDELCDDSLVEHMVYTNEVESTLQTEDKGIHSGLGLSHSRNDTFPMAGIQRSNPRLKGKPIPKKIDPNSSPPLCISQDTQSLPKPQNLYGGATSKSSPEFTFISLKTNPTQRETTIPTQKQPNLPPHGATNPKVAPCPLNRTLSHDTTLRNPPPTHSPGTHSGVAAINLESPRDYRILRFTPSVAFLRPTMINTIPDVNRWQKLFVPSFKNKRIGTYLSRQRTVGPPDSKQHTISNHPPNKPTSLVPSDPPSKEVSSPPSREPLPNNSFDPVAFELARKQIELGNFSAFSNILPQINVNMRDPEDQNNTLLHWAVGYNRPDIAKVLLAAGATQFSNDMGITPSELSTQALLGGDKTFQEMTDLFVGCNEV